MEKIKIAIADDQQLFRNAIAGLINDISDFELVAEAGNGEELLNILSNTTKMPDVVLVDLDMPVMNGVQLNEQLHLQYPAIKTIIVTVFNQERFISKLIEAGANGYLAKNCNIDELTTAIRTVYRTGFYFNDDCMTAMRNAAQHRTSRLKNINNIPIALTSREEEILLLLCKEYSTQEIAEELFISVRTAEGHRLNLLAKVGCKNTAGLVVFAIKHGLYEPWIG